MNVTTDPVSSDRDASLGPGADDRATVNRTPVKSRAGAVCARATRPTRDLVVVVALTATILMVYCRRPRATCRGSAFATVGPRISGRSLVSWRWPS
jgi:hypothetical protein